MSLLKPYFAFDALESALSFAARLAAFHTGGRLTAFLRDVGIAPMAMVSGEPEVIARLAEVSGTDRAVLEHNTPRVFEGIPAWCSSRMQMICSSLKRLFRLVCLLVWRTG